MGLYLRSYTVESVVEESCACEIVENLVDCDSVSTSFREIVSFLIHCCRAGDIAEIVMDFGKIVVDYRQYRGCVLFL